MELKGFTKLNESTSPELLKEDELTVFENMVLDEEIGKPKKRTGWARYNSNAVAGTISSLHEVQVSPSGVDYNYLLAGHSGKLQKSLDGTGVWEDVTSLGTPPYKMQPYADEFVFTEGSVPPFIVTDIENSTESVYNLEISKPAIETSDLQGGIHLSAGGNLDASANYKWLIVYITATGEVSPPSTPFTLHYLQYPALSTTTGATYKRIGFKNLPVSTDTRVTGRNIYRTMGNGEVFYFHSQIDNVVTTWFDETSDDYLGSESPDFVNAPATAEYITLHKERIILGNITRTVKNWFMPAYSKAASGTFTATLGETSYSFTGDLSDYASAKGLKNSIPFTGVGSTLAEGDYIYRFVFFDKDGLISDVVETNTVTVALPDNEIHIYTPPQIADSFDVIGRAEVYRQKDGGDWLLVKTYNPQVIASYQVDTGVYGWFDNGWAQIGSSVYDAGQTTDTEKCGIAFSQIGQPATFVLEDIRNIFPDDGDEIVGIFDDKDGILIFKEKSICKVFTGQGDPTNWNLVKLLPNIGCDEPNSLVKYGNDYIFSFQDSIYTWNSGSGYKEIGVEIWDTLSQVTAYHCATADSGWYMFGVSGAGLTTGYGFLIYDYNVGTWYKFTTTTIPYVAKIKENGNDIGTLITSNATYILYYSENETDSDTGSAVQITPKLRTKTFGESIALVRLRKVKFNYYKLSGQDVVITIIDPEDSTTNTYTDNTGSGWKLYESPVRDTDSLKEASKFYVNITGAGLVEFGTLRIEAKPILKGKRNG